MATVLEKASTISGKGQTTVPAEVRDALGVHVGDRVTFRVQEDGVVTVQREGNSDPALVPFLDFLASDIQKRPEALREITPALRDRLRQLTAGTTFDRDERLEGESGL